jgi:opacity protein-like surface antigen
MILGEIRQSGVPHVRSTLLAAVAAASLGLAAGPALAADVAVPEPVSDTFWYVGLFGGASFADDIEFEDDIGEVELGLDTGFNVGGVLGVDFSDYFRGEVELSYAQYGLDDCEAEGLVKCAPPDGDLSAFYALANLWFDFDVGGFSPYIGGGVGGAMLDIDSPPIGDDSAWGLAFQAGGGIRFDLGETVSVDLGYRFKGIPDISLGDFDSELYSHNAQIGVMFEF